MDGGAVIIYMAQNRETGGVYYGKTVKTLAKRQAQHLSDAFLSRNGSHFHKAIRKHGAAAFDWRVVEVCGDKDELNAREKHWIDLARRSGHSVYNLANGGDGGCQKGRQHAPPPKDVRAKIGAGLRAHYAANPGTMTGRSGKAAPMWGKRHSPEVRAKISTTHRAIPKPHMVGARNPSATAVMCASTGEIFATATLAASAHGADISSIIKCCRGKQKTANGRRYQYAEDAL